MGKRFDCSQIKPFFQARRIPSVAWIIKAQNSGHSRPYVTPLPLFPQSTEGTDGQLGVGSSFCQEATITRALQGAYRAASQSLGPLHQTLAFVALSSGRIGLANEDFTWGSTAEAVVALRSTLPADCSLQGICTWGVTGADGSGAGEEKEKEWAAVLLFSAQGRVVANGSTVRSWRGTRSLYENEL